MDTIAEIKRLYYATSRATIQRDIEQAIDLLKTLTSEDERERATVFMDGLSQMRSEWGVRPGGSDGAVKPAKTATPRTGSPARKAAAAKKR